MNRYLLIITLITITTFSFAQTDSAGYFLQKGRQERQAGRTNEVWKNLDKAYHYAPDNKEIIKELADVLLDLRKYGQARQLFLKLEEKGESSPELLKQIMDLSFNLKKQEDAILYANKLKQADPSARVYYIIGRVNYDMENYGEAIKYLDAAQKEEPEKSDIPYLIGRSYADMFNYKQAVPFYQKAIEKDTVKTGWVYELGMIYYAMGDNPNSLKYLLLAGERGYGKSSDYTYNLGIAYLNTGNLKEGITIFNELLKKRPSDLNILNIIAESYYYSGKYQEAMDYWDKILEYDMKNASALYMIGMCYQKKGEMEKGVALCDKAIELDPSLANLKQKKMTIGM